MGNSDSCHLVDENLYLGDISAVNNPELLRRMKVTHVVSVLEDMREVRQHLGMQYHQITLPDEMNSNLLQHFDVTFEFIEHGRRAGAVYVHCHAGISRSPSVVAAYLMRRYSLTADEAIQRIRASGRHVNPNPGFVRQLRAYQRMKCVVDQQHAEYRAVVQHMERWRAAMLRGEWNVEDSLDESESESSEPALPVRAAVNGKTDSSAAVVTTTTTTTSEMTETTELEGTQKRQREPKRDGADADAVEAGTLPSHKKNRSVQE